MKSRNIIIITIVLMILLLLLVLRTERREIREEDSLRNGIYENEMVIGSSSALTGHAGYLGTQTLHGALAYINYINENGGVHGRNITLISYDDQYDPPQTVYNTQKLIIEDNVFLLFNYVGTPTSVKVIKMVEEARIPLIGLFTGAHALREPLSRYIINIRASYYQETEKIIDYMINELGIKDIAVFYQYDAYGFDGLRGVDIALNKYGLHSVATGSYLRGTLSIENALEKIKNSGAEAVVMIGTYNPLAKFVKLARSRGFDPYFHSVSFVGPYEFAAGLGNETDKVFVTQVVPPYIEKKNFPVLDEYEQLLSKYYPDDMPNFVSLEGFINAKVLVEGLRRAGGDIDRRKFIDALESIESFDIGIPDSLVTFSKTDHQGMDNVFITEIEEGKFVLTKQVK